MCMYSTKNFTKKRINYWVISREIRPLAALYPPPPPITNLLYSADLELRSQ